MKKGFYFSKRERRVITLGYLCRWGVLGIIFLIPTIVFQICKLFNMEPQTQGFITILSVGITILGYGIYNIIGAVFEFKHVLVALQLANRRSANPRKNWSKSDKRENIGVGIIFAVLGLAIIILYTLAQFGVLN